MEEEGEGVLGGGLQGFTLVCGSSFFVFRLALWQLPPPFETSQPATHSHTPEVIICGNYMWLLLYVVIIICGNYMWLLYVVIMYGRYMWSSNLFFICGYHIWVI